jgi:hypothetical protein
MLPVIGALVAGLGLFFVGLNFLTEHLKMLSGRRLRERIATWTKRPLMAENPSPKMAFRKLLLSRVSYTEIVVKISFNRG